MSGENSSAQPILLIEQIMVTDVKCVTPEMTVREVIDLLMEHSFSGAPVVDQMEKVISVCCEGDLLRLAASVGLDREISSILGKLPKREKLLTLKRSNSFSEAYQMFLNNHVRRIIVTDGNGNLQGLVSRSDILSILCSPKTIDVA